MKSTIILALCVTIALAQQFTFTPVITDGKALQRSQQLITIMNNLPFKADGSNNIYNIYYYVSITPASLGAGATVDYGNGKFYASVGAISSGGVSGYAPFFVTGLAGNYDLTARIFYSYQGQKSNTTLNFKHKIVFKLGREIEAETEQNQAENYNSVNLMERDGSNTDLSCSGSNAGCNYSITAGTPGTWVKFHYLVGSVSINTITYSYTYSDSSLGTSQANTAATSCTANGLCQNLFQITGLNTGTYSITVSLSYKRAGVSKSWTATYPLVVSGSGGMGGKRELSDQSERVSKLAASAAALSEEANYQNIQNLQSKSAESHLAVPVNYALGAAGVAAIAAVAVFAIAYRMGSRKSSPIQLPTTQSV